MKPMCVTVSDIHFSVHTLKVASAALRLALAKAEFLGVPLVIAGDLNDTKDIVRAVVMNAIIAILKGAKVPVFILVGNHDLVNEKGDEHGLNYLRPYATVIDTTCPAPFSDTLWFMPYQNSCEKALASLALVPHGSVLIMHQGVRGAHMGEYVVDKTSLPVEAFAPFTCISGHYHKHQTVGTVTYISSPYTITSAEASDGDKGCLVVNEDGSFEREIFQLRRHRTIEARLETLEEADKHGTDPFDLPGAGDIIWLKLHGPRSELDALSKRELGMMLFGHTNYKLDRLPDEELKLTRDVTGVPPGEVLDQLIDAAAETPEQMQVLKALWRDIMS